MQYFHKNYKIYYLFALKACKEVEIGQQIEVHLATEILKSQKNFLFDRFAVVTDTLSRRFTTDQPFCKEG